MEKIYTSPLRVYLILAVLAIAGILSGFSLPVSLFPKSSKPSIGVHMPYGNISVEHFQKEIGRDLASKLQNIKDKDVEVSLVRSNYRMNNVSYTVDFNWDSDPNKAQWLVQNVVQQATQSLPAEIRDRLSVYQRNDSAGVFVSTFFSEQRTMDELYEILEQTMGPKLLAIQDAAGAGFYNPSRKEVRVTLKPDSVTRFQILPQTLDIAIQKGLQGYKAGALRIHDMTTPIIAPPALSNLQDLESLPIKVSADKVVTLREIADIRYAAPDNSDRMFKTNGAESIVLFAEPKPGGNIKQMSDDLLKVIETSLPELPKDIQFRNLINPSEFIQSAIQNVLHEVFLASFLAVIILFLFIGNIRNVITTAIEIPLSILLAFLLMKWFDINLNLISLGGLALSAGMNVDASVVVMENIVRHFHGKKESLSWNEKIKIVLEAVQEVKVPILASTVTSLVVFIPILMTSSLTKAILGDLAKAVIFSHGFSAFIALILVPTIRLQILQYGLGSTEEKPPLLEKQLKGLENLYARLLEKLVSLKKIRLSFYGFSLALFFAIILFCYPKLPQEVTGVPDTDYLGINIQANNFTLVKQMENHAAEVEAKVSDLLGDELRYTFLQIQHSTNAYLIVRINHKKQAPELIKKLEKLLTDTPDNRFNIEQWNPSELPIPDPPHVRIAIRGKDKMSLRVAQQQIREQLEKEVGFSRVYTDPDFQLLNVIELRPSLEQWKNLEASKSPFSPQDLMDTLRVSTEGRPIGDMKINQKMVPIKIGYPTDWIKNIQDVGAFPVPFNGKLFPMKAFLNPQIQQRVPNIYEENGTEMGVIYGRMNQDDKSKVPDAVKKTKGIVQTWNDNRSEDLKKNLVSATFEDPDKNISSAKQQLGYAILISLFLIFITLVLQFGSFIEPILVLVAIPTAIMGVCGSLFLFKSEISLNSILGVILLNGISVANSIILVDFARVQYKEGKNARDAVISAAQARLRPILITSLTSVLGMLPIAFGLGDGGKILQPLGIAVSGGLWISTCFTLFLVPSLHYLYLQFRSSQKKQKESI